MGHDIFISYASKDRKAAEVICRALESGKVRVWMAPRNLAPSSTWAEAIPTAIDASRLVLLVFSKHVNASEWVPREIQHAVHTKKRIMTVRLADAEPTSSLSFFLSTLHWLDAFPEPLPQHLPAVTRHCQNLLGVRPDARPAAPQVASIPAAQVVAKAAAPPASQRRAVVVGAAAAGALALLAAVVGVVWSVSGPPRPTVATGDGAATQDAAVAAEAANDCSLAYGNRMLDANLREFELPSSQPLSGGYAVVDVATLRINDSIVIKLAGVGRGDARGAERLRKWLENSGPVVACRPADDRRCRYFCVNEDQQDISKMILTSRWATPASTSVSSQN